MSKSFEAGPPAQDSRFIEVHAAAKQNGPIVALVDKGTGEIHFVGEATPTADNPVGPENQPPAVEPTQ